MADPTTPTTPPAPAAAAQPDFLKQLAAALAAVGAGIGGKAIANAQGNPLTQAVPPQVSQLLDQSVARQAYQNPLFQATTQGVYDMLPDFAKSGTSLSGTLSNVAPPAPAQGSGGPGLGTAALVGGSAGLAALLAKLLGSGGGAGGDLQKVFDAIKKKFGSNPNGGAGAVANPPIAGAGAGSFDADGNWVPGGEDPLTPETSGRAIDPTTGQPLGFAQDPSLVSNPFGFGGATGNWPTDPSGGTGIGPGMRNYYGNGGGDLGNGRDLP